MSKRKENHFENIEEEVKVLRKQNAGMRGQISLLQKQVNKYKELDLEGDGLYEKKVEECESLKRELDAALCVRENTVPYTKVAELERTIKTKNSFIESLQERVQCLMLEKSELEGKVGSLTDEQTELYATIEELQKPWWKRVF